MFKNDFGHMGACQTLGRRSHLARQQLIRGPPRPVTFYLYYLFPVGGTCMQKITHLDDGLGFRNEKTSKIIAN